MNLWCDFSNRWEPSVGIAPLGEGRAAIIAEKLRQLVPVRAVRIEHRRELA
ncbi:MAG: hypothetical protein ACOY99_00190 [Pseudomonadota bacterium]